MICQKKGFLMGIRQTIDEVVHMKIFSSLGHFRQLEVNNWTTGSMSVNDCILRFHIRRRLKQ